MNHFIWIGIIVWGVLVTLFGMGTLTSVDSTSLTAQMPPHDLAFLVACGMLSCLIGALGLTGLLHRLPLFGEGKK
ncbi:hypothetical protein E4L96_09615 [Massilia arenosa]|uniref:Uncharacterized protein n=1 Tax=Zemynaea arenosa TaxID=2561931 RepID=A0A4Y9SDT5_9BURK|nr:hypothetical protein [Massilia arenosa]TFW21049.1 hypothetical protein E4L96_09615 [Massilia arenosa]